MSTVVLLRGAVSLSGRFPLLAGVDLEIDGGEILHLLGSNGAGKTSLLRAIAGLVPIVAGEAVVLGHDLRIDRRAVRRDIGLVGHSTALYEDLTPEENVVFALRAARVATAGAHEALERLGITDRLATTRVAKLSQGQRRRVALAALVARRPAIWLLDEPHAGLDASGRLTVDAVIAEAAESGITVVFASHELDRAARIATRVVEIGGGVVVELARNDRKDVAGDTGRPLDQPNVTAEPVVTHDVA
ncbi:MAG TPA: heme ABC exporter ATP-binding protein CcmA [Acidimicrobiales bacterium]|jgi:heme ABC exporter ATP-binding subunit CcmA|nr:heme ABC exporter ATP-binding protein CcmA [Acidimicrobiales bacterium]